MNAMTEIRPFDSYAAYERERAWTRTLENRLARAAALLRFEVYRRESAGEDASGLRAFIAECAS